MFSLAVSLTLAQPPGSFLPKGAEVLLRTWQRNGPLLALQGCTRHRGLAQTCHVHSTHLELVENVLLQVFGLEKQTRAVKAFERGNLSIIYSTV